GRRGERPCGTRPGRTSGGRGGAAPGEGPRAGAARRRPPRPPGGGGRSRGGRGPRHPPRRPPEPRARMLIGEVVGRLWASRQAATLGGQKLLLVRPLAGPDRGPLAPRNRLGVAGGGLDPRPGHRRIVAPPTRRPRTPR